MVDPRITRKRRRRLTVTILVTLLMLMTASAFAVWSYVRGLDTKINRVVAADSALAGQLSGDAPKAPGEPFYMLLMGDDRRPGETQARSDTLILARVDPKLKKIQLISIPRDSRVKIPGYSAPQKINAASAWGGPALTIKTVKDLTGLPIAHYLTVGFSGLRRVVDTMGGVWIDIPQDIDENTTHTKYGAATRVIKKGYQKLDGVHALTFVRARHSFADGDFSRVKNQQLFIKALVKQGLSLSAVVNAPKIIAAVSDNISTDLTVGQLAELAAQFKGMKDADLDSATVPSKNGFIDGIAYVIIDEPAFEKMLGRMQRGEPLNPSKPASGSKSSTSTASPAAIKPGTITLTVRNGAGVSGLAKTASDLFVKAGFLVKESGNMNQFVYSRTLVVFKTGTDAKAGVVQDELGYGDVVPAAGLYKFNTDVLVIVGKDWRTPASASRP
ncbi:MAG: LCP family protein [Coriobacteriia bacterium]|nr:LCP family protein [Coriobacteriia bacterium]